MRFAFLLAFALLFCVDAGAVEWRTDTGSETAGYAKDNPNPGTSVYLYTDDASATAGVDLRKCANGADVFFNRDTVGGLAGASIALSACPTSALARCLDLTWANDLGARTNDLDGDASTGGAAVFGVRSAFLKVVLTNAGTKTTETTLVCH